MPNTNNKIYSLTLHCIIRLLVCNISFPLNSSTVGCLRYGFFFFCHTHVVTFVCPISIQRGFTWSYTFGSLHLLFFCLFCISSVFAFQVFAWLRCICVFFFVTLLGVIYFQTLNMVFGVIYFCDDTLALFITKASSCTL